MTQLSLSKHPHARWAVDTLRSAPIAFLYIFFHKWIGEMRKKSLTWYAAIQVVRRKLKRINNIPFYNEGVLCDQPLRALAAPGYSWNERWQRVANTWPSSFVNSVFFHVSLFFHSWISFVFLLRRFIKWYSAVYFEKGTLYQLLIYQSQFTMTQKRLERKIYFVVSTNLNEIRAARVGGQNEFLTLLAILI